MGREIRKEKGVDFEEEERMKREIMKEMEEDIDKMKKVEELSIGKKKVVEIESEIQVNQRIIIMDEKNQEISDQEVEVMLKVIREMKERGVEIVYIQNNMEEEIKIKNNEVVMREGKMKECEKSEEIDMEWIVRNMVGEKLEIGYNKNGYEWGDVEIQVEEMKVKEKRGSGLQMVERMQINVREGEIV